MMKQPILFLTVGLPSTGKTTAARRMEVERNAPRLTKDEWVKALYGLWSRDELRSTAGSGRSRCEGGDVLLRSHPSRAAETT